MSKRNRKLFLVILLILLSMTHLSACSKDLGKGYSYNKKYKGKDLNVGHLKTHGFKLEFADESFDGNQNLKVDVLSNETSESFKEEHFAFYMNPLELHYGEEENIRLNTSAVLNVKVPKEYYGTEFDVSELMFANFYDGKWEYFLPDAVDLTTKVASISVDHFSYWGFGKVSEETQIETFAKYIANNNYEKEQNKDKLYTLLGRQYEDLFNSMGIRDESVKSELAHNVIEYLEGKIYQDNSLASKISPITNLISLAHQGEEALNDILSDLTGQALLEALKLEPSYFSSALGITSGLSSAAGSLIEGDTDAALQGIKEALHANLMIKLSDNLLTYVKESGEYAIEIWSAGELEKAYQAYTGEGTGKYGYHSGLEGDFNAIFTLLGGGQRQMEINILKKYMEKYNIDEKDLTQDAKKRIIDNAYRYLENSFKERKIKNAEILISQEKEKEFIQLMKEADFLKEYFYRDYFGMNTKNAKYDISDRLRRLYIVKETVLNILDPEEAEIISDKELITLMEQYIKFRERNDLDKFYEQLRKTGYLKQLTKLKSGYSWKLVDQKQMIYPNTDTTKVTLSEGKASISMTCTNCEDLFDAGTTWSTPKDSYKADEEISLDLSAQIEKYVWKDDSYPYLHMGLNYVGTEISATLDVHDLSLGRGTAAAIRLIDTKGNNLASVHTDYGEIETEYQSDTFTAHFPSGFEKGEKLGLYITSNGIGSYVYIYEWR